MKQSQISIHKVYKYFFENNDLEWWYIQYVETVLKILKRNND